MWTANRSMWTAESVAPIGSSPADDMASPWQRGAMSGNDTTAVSALTDRIRGDLTEAMRSRDRTTAAVLRTLLATISNAEAQPAASRGSGAAAPAGEDGGRSSRPPTGSSQVRSAASARQRHLGASSPGPTCRRS